MVCLWNDLRSTECTYAGNVVTMHAPFDSDITANTEYSIYISTTNADDVDNNGILYPANSGLYFIEVEIDYTGDGTLDRYGCDNIEVFPTLDESTLRIVPGNTSENSETGFKVSFTVPMTLNQLHYWKITFPTRDKWGNTLFDDDLGTGLSNGAPIPCSPTDYTLMGYNTKCLIIHGEGSIAKPVEIRVYPENTLSNGDTPEINIIKVKNPTTGGDDRIIHMTFLVVQDDDTFLFARTIWDVYYITLTAEVSSPPPGTAVTASGLPIFSNPQVFTIPLLTPVQAATNDAVFLILFPTEMPLTDAQGSIVCGGVT